jgi:Asp-tRNA(Asn)/Glu-tRNA(Gln) amidotransferase A subunit family amidase
MSSPQFDTIGPFGKTVGDVACLLDVLIPEGGFMSSLSTEKPKLSIGVSSERLSHITSEEEDLFHQAQDYLSSVITTKDVRVPLHMQAGEADCANLMMDQGLVNAWDGYLKGVDGPMKSLRDVVEWHSLHPVGAYNWGFPG